MDMNWNSFLRTIRIGCPVLAAIHGLLGPGLYGKLTTQDASIDYSAWPAYEQTPLHKIEPQAWRTEADVIEGWDWSLPPGTSYLETGLMAIRRSFNLEKSMYGFLEQLDLPINPTVTLWIRWKHLEPEEGNFRFDVLKERIQEAEGLGYGVVLRLLCSAEQFAPDWMADYSIPFREEQGKKKPKVTNYEISHSDFHKRYLRLIQMLGESGIPGMSALRGAYVGYASPSFGDEGIGPDGVDPDTVPHVIERLDTWARAFKGVENKVFMGGPSDYGFELGFGTRRGFVEMYLYHIPDPYIGQWLDKEGYLRVDEDAIVLRNNAFNGEENEEYEPFWAAESHNFRFGRDTSSFVYRYFNSNLRLIQMRSNYVLYNDFSIFPEQFVWVGQNLGRTVENAPDVWCALRESYLGGWNYEKVYGKEDMPSEPWREPIPVKNFERWLYQRDGKGFKTRPEVAMRHASRMWMVQKDMDYDYVARRGKYIGFDVDNRWCGGSTSRLAVKVSFFNTRKDDMTIKVRTRDGWENAQVKVDGTGGVRTATAFFDNAVFAGKQTNDIILECRKGKVPVAFVRAVNAAGIQR